MRPEIRKIQEMMEAADYVTDAPVATAVHLAMTLRKPLLIEGHRLPWSRRLLLGLIAASWLLVPIGSWATTAVATVGLAGLSWRLATAPSALDAKQE